MIRFTEDVDGIYKAGQVVVLEAGVEDALVNWRNVAVYLTLADQHALMDEGIQKNAAEFSDASAKAKAIDAPPADKMMRAPKAKKSLERF